MKYRFLLCVACILFLIGSGCTEKAPADPTPIPISGHVTFAGSTTVQPLAAKIGQAFNEYYPDVKLDIAAGGSTVGIKAIRDGTVDIGMASRKLKPEEEEGATVYQIAVDVLAVVVNEANTIESLSSEQLQDIYQGNISNWKEVGGADAPIVVVIREKNSGTRGAFDDIVLEGQEPYAEHLEKAITAGDMAAIVADMPDAIGYVGFGNLEPGIKALAIDGVVPSDETAKEGSYQLTRPLLLLTGPLTQPIAQYFIDFALSTEGQKIVADSGWVTAQWRSGYLECEVKRAPHIFYAFYPNMPAVSAYNVLRNRQP